MKEAVSLIFTENLLPFFDSKAIIMRVDGRFLALL